MDRIGWLVVRQSEEEFLETISNKTTEQLKSDIFQPRERPIYSLLQSKDVAFSEQNYQLTLD